MLRFNNVDVSRRVLTPDVLVDLKSVSSPVNAVRTLEPRHYAALVFLVSVQCSVIFVRLSAIVTIKFAWGSVFLCSHSNRYFLSYAKQTVGNSRRFYLEEL